MSQVHIRFESGTQLVSRFPQGMHTMTFVKATVREVQADAYLIDLGSGRSVRYGLSELHSDFLICQAESLSAA